MADRSRTVGQNQTRTKTILREKKDEFIWAVVCNWLKGLYIIELGRPY